MSVMYRGKTYQSLNYWNDNTGINNIFQYPKNLFNIGTSGEMFNYFLALYSDRIVNYPYDTDYNNTITKILVTVTSLTKVNEYKIKKWIETTEYQYDPINPYTLTSEKNITSDDTINTNNKKDVTKHSEDTVKKTDNTTVTLDTSLTDVGTSTQSGSDTLSGSDTTTTNNTVNQNSTTGSQVTTYVSEDFFNTDKISGNIAKTENGTNKTDYGKTNTKNYNNSINDTQKQTGTNKQDTVSDTTKKSDGTDGTTEINKTTKNNISNIGYTEKGNKWNYLFSQMIMGERDVADFSALILFFEIIAKYILLPIYDEEDYIC